MFLSEVGFEPTPSERTATWTQRLRPLGHPDLALVQVIKYQYDKTCSSWLFTKTYQISLM